MYKSSPITIFFILFVPAFFIIATIINMYSIWSQGVDQHIGFGKAMSINTIWVGFFIIQFPFRLKNIVAADMGLLIKGLGKNASLIDYKDIDYIARFDILNPFFMTIKYRDQISGEHKKIFFMPSKGDQRIFADDKLTERIKELMKKNNPNWSEDHFPSSIRNFIVLIAICIPVGLLSFYFLNLN